MTRRIAFGCESHRGCRYRARHVVRQRDLFIAGPTLRLLAGDCGLRARGPRLQLIRRLPRRRHAVGAAPCLASLRLRGTTSQRPSPAFRAGAIPAFYRRPVPAAERTPRGGRRPPRRAPRPLARHAARRRPRVPARPAARAELPARRGGGRVQGGAARPAVAGVLGRRALEPAVRSSRPSTRASASSSRQRLRRARWRRCAARGRAGRECSTIAAQPAASTSSPTTRSRTRSRVICRLLGVPTDRQRGLLDWSHRAREDVRVRTTTASGAAATAAAAEFIDYVVELDRGTRRSPRTTSSRRSPRSRTRATGSPTTRSSPRSSSC